MSGDGRHGGLPPGFARFWWGEAVSGMGTAVTTLSLQTLVVVTMEGGATEVGWLNTARWLPYLALGLVVGALVDRVRRRPVMVVSDLVRALLLGLVPLAWALDLLSLPVLLVVVLLFGTASVVNDAASFSFVPRLVDRDGKRTTLTAYGELVAARAERILFEARRSVLAYSGFGARAPSTISPMIFVRTLLSNTSLGKPVPGPPAPAWPPDGFQIPILFGKLRLDPLIGS